MTDTELRIRVAVLEKALGNVYLLAKKYRNGAIGVGGVEHLLRFCEEAGFTSSPLRAEAAEQRLADTELLLQNANETVRRVYREMENLLLAESRADRLAEALQGMLDDLCPCGCDSKQPSVLAARAALEGETK